MERYQQFLQKSGIDYKEYQSKGVQWCIQRETIPDERLPDVRGGFIADEMGLGKTIMMIATFICNFVDRTLVVLPNVILEQWRTEILRTTKHEVLIFHGASKKKITLDMLNTSPVVLTTYHSIMNPESLLHQVQWDRLVFDEAHHLRNNTRIFHGANLLKARIRWLISGTPIQNRLKDMHQLCTVLRIPPDFRRNVDSFKYLIHNFVMKRTKKQVGILLPELTVHVDPIQWSNVSECKLSKQVHRIMNSQTGLEKLRWMTMARQSCILPGLLNNKRSLINEEKEKEKGKEVINASYQGLTKIQTVVNAVLSNKGNGNGKLIFCHFRLEIDIVVQMLKTGGITSICFFDGRVSQTERNRLLTQPFEVIVLQIQTGCEGLNLQKDYSEIYFVSPHWNPSVEDQAVARCHRIGQTKPVHVYKFFMDQFNKSDPTVNLDQYISHIQNNKREITNSIFNS